MAKYTAAFSGHDTSGYIPACAAGDVIVTCAVTNNSGTYATSPGDFTTLLQRNVGTSYAMKIGYKKASSASGAVYANWSGWTQISTAVITSAGSVGASAIDSISGTIYSWTGPAISIRDSSSLTLRYGGGASGWNLTLGISPGVGMVTGNQPLVATYQTPATGVGGTYSQQGGAYFSYVVGATVEVLAKTDPPPQVPLNVSVLRSSFY